MGGEPDCQDFGNEFGKGVDEANWPEISDRFGGFFFGNEGDNSRVHSLQGASVEGVQTVKSIQNLCLDDVPTRLIKRTGEAIRPWRFIRRQTGDGLFDFLLRERVIQPLNFWELQNVPS